MNDWARTKLELEANYPNANTKRQMWQWSAGFREWVDARGTDVRAIEGGDIAGYLEQEDWGPGTKNRHQRITAIRALVDAARVVAPARAKSPASAAAWLDQIPARSPRGKAIARVLAAAKTEGDRRRWRTALGTFGRWCESHQIALIDAWPGDVDAFRRDYLESGRTSPGEYIRVARMLLREIAANQ